MNIEQCLSRLTQEHAFETDFFDLVRDIMHSCLRSSDLAPAAARESAEEQAADFIFDLSQRRISGTIRTRNDLLRECRRWLAAKQAPERQELWLVLSKALRKLESRGKVCRPEDQRAYNNTNSTRWALVSFAGRVPEFASLPGVLQSMPTVAAKGKNDRILNPSEAEGMLLYLLKGLAGELTMAEIMEAVARRMPLFHELTVLNAPQDDDENGTCLLDCIEGAAQLSDYALLVEEEATLVGKTLWERAASIRKGRADSPVRGTDVLCGYFLPKYFSREKVKLEQFGSSSTVNEIVHELLGILRDMLQPEQAAPLDQWLTAKLIEALEGKLRRICSEIGCASRLTEAMEGACHHDE